MQRRHAGSRVLHAIAEAEHLFCGTRPLKRRWPRGAGTALKGKLCGTEESQHGDREAAGPRHSTKLAGSVGKLVGFKQTLPMQLVHVRWACMVPAVARKECLRTCEGAACGAR